MRAAMAALASQSQPKYDFAQSKRHSRGGARDHQGQDQSRGPLQQPRRMRSMQMQGDPGSIVQHRYGTLLLFYNPVERGLDMFYVFINITVISKQPS